MTFKFIDYKKEFSNGNYRAVDSKWVSFDTFDGRHVEGIAYLDDRSNIRAYGYNDIVIANQGGNVMVPSVNVFADSIRFIEPFTVPRIVLMDNTSITCQIDNPKPNGSYVQVILLDGRRIKIHGMSIKYIEEPFALNNNVNTTASTTDTKPTRIIENPINDTASNASTTANTNHVEVVESANNMPLARSNANNANSNSNHHVNNSIEADDDSSPVEVEPGVNTVNTTANSANNGAQLTNSTVNNDEQTNNNPVNTTVNANNADSNVPVALNTDNESDNSISFDNDSDEYYDDLDADTDLDTDADSDSELDTDDADQELDADADADYESGEDSDSDSDDFDDDNNISNANANNASNRTSTNMSDNNHVRMRLPVHMLNNASKPVSIRRPVNLDNSSVPTADNTDLSEMLTSDDYDNEDIDNQMNEPGVDNTGDSDDYWDDNDTILDLDTDDDNGMNII